MIIKHPGNKKSILPILDKLGLLPLSDYVIEPFAGSLSFSIYMNKFAKTDYFIVNDIDSSLIELYQEIKKDNGFEIKIEEYTLIWTKLQKISYEFIERITFEDFITNRLERKFIIFERQVPLIDNRRVLHTIIKSKLRKKIKFLKTREEISFEIIAQQIQNAIMSAFYYYFRDWVKGDNPMKTWLIYELSYGSLIRYSKVKQKVNSPFGQYVKKDLKEILTQRNIKYVKLFSLFEFTSIDFENFLNNIDIDEGERFYFIDPPYPNIWNKYSGKNFERADQERLFECIVKLSREHKFLMIVNDSPYYRKTYRQYKIQELPSRQYKIPKRNINGKKIEYICIYNY